MQTGQPLSFPTETDSLMTLVDSSFRIRSDTPSQAVWRVHALETMSYDKT